MGLTSIQQGWTTLTSGLLQLCPGAIQPVYMSRLQPVSCWEIPMGIKALLLCCSILCTDCSTDEPACTFTGQPKQSASFGPQILKLACHGDLVSDDAWMTAFQAL